MSKRVLFLITVIFMFFANGIIIAFCAIQNTIIINGEMIIKNDKIYIPLTTAGAELGYYVKWNSDKKEAVVIKYDMEYPANIFHYVASDLDKIQLFALNKKEPENGSLSDFILTVDGINKVFKWEGQDINRQPIMSLINDDNHIAVVTNTAAGTGIHGQKLHVVDKKSLEEIPVNDISEYLKNYVRFTLDSKNFTMTTDKRSWSLPYDLNKWTEATNEPNDLESYYKYMIESAIKYQSYYIANDEIVTCLIAVKDSYAEQQAIGVFQFDYTFNSGNYIISKMDFTKFNNIEKLYKWIYSWGV